MKKIMSLVVMIAFCSTLLLLGCSGANSIKLNKKYFLSNIEFMGFSGNRSSVQKYLDSQDSVEEINVFSDYFDLALRARFSFGTQTSGTLTIPQMVAAFNTNNAELNNKIDDAREAGIINASGDLIINFDYNQNKNKITIGKVHTQILSTGDLDFAEAITELVSYMSGDSSKNNVRITNQTANVFEIKNGKIEITLQLEYRRNSDSENPDMATTLKLKLA